MNIKILLVMMIISSIANLLASIFLFLKIKKLEGLKNDI